MQLNVTRLRLVVLILSLAAATTSAFLCWKMLGLRPHVADELSYLFQGRLFANGKLWISAPAVPGAFASPWDHILRTSGKWRSIYPPGWPLLLAIGWCFHSPWLINPLLLILAAFGTFELAQRVYDSKTALISVIAFLASPFVLLQSAGFMSHLSTLTFTVWCLYFLFGDKKNDAAIAGFLGTYAFMIRPYTAVFLLLPALLFRFATSHEKKNFIFKLTVGAFPVFVLFAIYNQLLYGNVFKTGYSYDPDAKFRGSLSGHFLEHIPWYFGALNQSLWGWPFPDLLIFLPLIRPREGWKKDLALFVCFAALLCAYSIFYYSDIIYSGPRYVFEAMTILTILAARSIVSLPRKITWVACLLFVYPLFVRLPEQIRYHSEGYHGQPQQLLDLVRERGIGENALILITGDPYVYRMFLLENAIQPDHGTRVFAQDIPGKREELLRNYPRKEVWLMKIHLKFLDGVNEYPDRSRIENVTWTRIVFNNTFVGAHGVRPK